MHRREALAALLAGPFMAARAINAQSGLPSVALAKEGDLTALTIAEASRRLAARAITPLQLTNAYLARIGSLNNSLNAYTTVTADLARREAKDLDQPKGPLFGIPIAHKDLFETRGVRTTAGSLLFEHNVPATNAFIVQRLEDAGAVMLGKTNTHELGGGVTTINPFFGTTRNPVDATRIAGGSSGGSAAAVAAHLCAAATGSDTGGSVRIPAAFCGCVGFKPTFGKISTTGLLGSCPTFDHVGILARTVEDTQIMFRALGGGTSDAALPARIRVGVPSTTYFYSVGDPEVETAFARAVAHMGSMGAQITKVVPPVDDRTMARVFDPIVSFEIWNRLGADWRINPGSFSKDFAAFFSTPRPSIAEYESALAALKEYQAAFDAVFDSVDVMVTPTVLVTAPPIAGPIDGMKILRNTWPFNAAGTPAISIPLMSQSLPVGLQVVARRGEDDKLLRIVRRFF